MSSFVESRQHSSMNLILFGMFSAGDIEQCGEISSVESRSAFVNELDFVRYVECG